KIGGAVLKQDKAREINEIACRKLESNVGSELLRIRNNLNAIEARRNSLTKAAGAAEQEVTGVEQNLAGGLASQLEYRVAESGYLKTKSGVLEATYLHNVALAEWDRATGRYLQFSDDTRQNVQ